MKHLLLAGSAAFLTICAAPAWAEAGDEDADSGDIVVTATRSESLLSKTPITMTALSGDTLRDAGVTDARALTTQVPGLALTENGDAVRISIRGVTSTDTTEKGDPSASFLVNGIYIARPADVLGSFYDVARVEVLRGPQGTLYGRNTTAGVINVITNRPTDQFGASLEGSYGNFGSVDATGVVNVPVGEGIGVRAAVNYQRQDPYYTIAGTPTYKLDPYRDVLSGRLSFGGTVAENFTFNIVGDYSKTKGSGVNGNTVTLDRFFPGALSPALDPVYIKRGSDYQRTLSVAPTFRNSRDNKNYGITGELSHDFGPVQLTYLGAYRKTDRQDVRNLLLFSSLNNPAFFFGHFKQDSHELRLAFGKDQRLHGQVGAYYFHEKSSLEFNLGAPLSGFVVPGATGFAFPQGPTVAKSQAAFGQLTFDLTPDLHLNGGVRYTHDEKSRNGATVVDFPTVASSICGKTRCVLNENIASRKFNKTIWKVGLDYDAPGLGLIYATVSTGYKAGGFNDGCVTGSGVGCSLTASALYFNPETLTNFEGGIKFRLSSAVRLNAALFHYDYKSLQVSQIVTVPVPATLIRNAASATVNGLELEFHAQLSDNDRFDADYAYTDAKYKNFKAQVSSGTQTLVRNFHGAELDHAPKHVVSFGYTHTFPIGDGKLDDAARTRLSSEYFMIDLNNASQFRQPSFHKTDLTLTYNAPEDRFFLQGFVKNLEDTVTMAAASSGLGAGVVIEAPRTYGVRAGVKF